MKLNPDDPKLTAYALGELPWDEAAAVEEAIAASAEGQAWVANVRAMEGTMRAEFGADLVERKPLNIMPLPTARSFWSDNRWASISVAALLAIAALVAAALFPGTPGGRSASARAASEVQMEFETEPFGVQLEGVGTLTGQGDRFVSAEENPIATFSVEVGKASYLDVQRTIQSGSLPARGTVRVEEMINYFAYDDPPPESDDRPFSITAEVAGCPWRAEHRLVRIALKASGRTGSATVARDVTAQVEFNPTRVTSYRLIGYDQPRDVSFDVNPAAAGQIHSGDAVTVLYEVVPSATAAGGDETLVVRLQYKQPKNEAAELVEEPVMDEGQEFASASPDFKFAAAVAEFGMFLRNSSVGNGRSLGAIADLAKKGRGPDRDGRRAGFLELMRQAQLLTRG